MHICMRTTLNINDRLIRLAKKRAAETGQTVTRIIEEALRESLVAEKRPGEKPFRLVWTTVRGRVLPGVDLTDRDALYERMEGRA